MNGCCTIKRALVCVYLFGGVGESKLVSKSGDAALHPAALELQNLRQRGELRVLTDFNSPAHRDEGGLSPEEVMVGRYAGLRFLPNGFATPEWAALLAGLQGNEGSGAYTFQNGMSLVVPAGAVWQGAQFENPTLRQAMDQTHIRPSAFPNTAIGLQLADVSRLLLASAKLGIRQPIFLCNAGGFSQGAQRSGSLAIRYGELSRAMKAFHDATLALGVERFVTTYTDGESPAVPGRTRLVIGGRCCGWRNHGYSQHHSRGISRVAGSLAGNTWRSTVLTERLREQ